MKRSYIYYILFSISLVWLAASAGQAAAQSSTPLIVRVRTAAGQPISGAIVKLIWGQQSATATTDSAGLAHFAAVGQSLYLRLLPGSSGVGMVNEEAQRYSLPPLRFQVQPSGRISVFVDGDGWVYPDAGGDKLPATPVMQGMVLPVAHPYTQNEINQQHGLPTLGEAAAAATAAAFASAVPTDPRRAAPQTGATPAPLMLATPITLPGAASPVMQASATPVAVAMIRTAAAAPQPASDNTWQLYLCLGGLVVLASLFVIAVMAARRPGQAI